MFALVALMALYLGGNNIRKAFILAPFSQWKFINWSLLFTGILMLIVCVACIWQANKDYKAKQEELAKKEREEKAKRQRQFFYDEELASENKNSVDEN